MTLDELFGILDCYVEEYHWNTSPWTTVTYNGASANADSLTTKITTDCGTNSTFYGNSDLQLKSSH